jgi:hypothetical protein
LATSIKSIRLAKKSIKVKIGYILIICLIFNFEINTRAQTSCDFIKNVRAFQKSVKLIEHPGDESKVPEVDTTSFNITIYMSLFNKLKTDSGKVCCLIGCYDNRAGVPLLYAKDKNFNENEYISRKISKANERIDSTISRNILKYKRDNLSENQINRMIRFYESIKRSYDRTYALIIYARDPVNKLCNSLIPDDSQEGYLQYLFFNQMGEQFALYWHSYYGEKTVLCNKMDVEYFISKERKESFEYDENKIRDLLNFDLSPAVELDSTNCTIRWYEIYTHSGIFKNTYKIERRSPFRVKNIVSEQIATISPKFLY